MKNRNSGRRHKDPHQNEGFEKKDAPFFSKENKAPFFNGKGAGIQPKLTVGRPDDKYEKEADSMADAVVNNTSGPDIQNKEISSIQRVSLATPEKDEKFATAEQRMEEDKLIQEKPESESIEEPEEEMISKMDDEREEEASGAIQTKSNTNHNTASPGLTQQIKNKSGKGKKLPEETRTQMEPAFGADFGEVNIHTDKEAVEMNRTLGAQAFTHGRDIYFNEGKYNPDTTDGKRLLAHELTHTIQQKGKKGEMQNSVIQRYGGCNSTEDSTISADHSMALSWLNSTIVNLASYNGTSPAKVHTALSTHFGGATSAAFGAWVLANLIYLRSVAWMAGYQCETTGGSFWACTGPNTLATTFWCVPGVDIRLCPGYFSSSTNMRVTTLIHEWVHKYGCNLDLGYEHEPEYGGSGTVRQLFNADSFANFVRDAH